MPRWWPFGGHTEPTPGAGDGAVERAPEPAELSEYSSEVERVQVEPDGPREAQIAARLVSRTPAEHASGEDLQTAADFHRSLVNRLWDDARPGVLGEGGGLGDMASFLREASHLAGGVMDKPVSREVMRDGDEFAATHSVEPLHPRDLSTLMSFS